MAEPDDPNPLPPANTLELSPPSTPEPEPTPMIDIHPAHHAATTWRDFFIHIATIVLGLLIAIGLEQTVEYIHHRRQVAEAREALRQERELNIQTLAHDTGLFRALTTEYQTNLAVLLYLQKHPNAQPQTWPGKINWRGSFGSFDDAAWVTAQHDNVTALMPQNEVQAYEDLYNVLATVTASNNDRTRAVLDARRYMVRDSDPSHLTPPQLAQEIVFTQNVLTAQYRLGGTMRNIATAFPDFKPAPTPDELFRIMHEVGPTAIDFDPKH